MPIQNQTEDLVANFAEATKDQFVLKPKESNCLYQIPYPKWFERVPSPHHYESLEFFKISGQDNALKMEHIVRYLRNWMKLLLRMHQGLECSHY